MFKENLAKRTLNTVAAIAQKLDSQKKTQKPISKLQSA